MKPKRNLLMKFAWHHPEGFTSREVAKSIGDTTRTVAAQLSILEKEGYIQIVEHKGTITRWAPTHMLLEEANPEISCAGLYPGEVMPAKIAHT